MPKKMDNPKVKVKNTIKYGKSLFAIENIRKGEIIADWIGGSIYFAKKASDLPNEPPNFVQDHAIQFDEHKWIDYEGIGRYFAHSCNPNCGFKGRFKIVTLRDIKKNEELTFDYEMSEDSDWRMKCKCGSNECRKNIGAFSLLPKEARKRYNGYISGWLKKKYRLTIS